NLRTHRFLRVGPESYLRTRERVIRSSLPRSRWNGQLQSGAQRRISVCKKMDRIRRKEHDCRNPDESADQHKQENQNGCGHDSQRDENHPQAIPTFLIKRKTAAPTAIAGMAKTTMAMKTAIPRT